jgi:antitoxin (DNA-binding transcriptional repressor) of toxin-antitoxin stability system
LRNFRKAPYDLWVINAERPTYDELVARLGVPVSVEDARSRWASLVDAARNSTTTMITRERWEWAALVPLSRVSGVLSGLSMVPLSTARTKLGDLVRQVADPYYNEPVLLGRHRKPVAGLVSAQELLERDAPPAHPDADALLAGGHTITLSRDPVRQLVVAVARDQNGAEISAGAGRSAAEALRFLAKPPPWGQPDWPAAGMTTASGPG